MTKMIEILLLFVFVMISSVYTVRALDFTIIDDFNRPDNTTLGTATNGDVWGQSNNNSQCFHDITGNRMRFYREKPGAGGSGGAGENGGGCSAELNFTKNMRHGSIFSLFGVQTLLGGESGIVEFVDGNTSVFSLFWDDNGGAGGSRCIVNTTSGSSGETCLIQTEEPATPSTGWTYNINFTFNFDNDTVDIFFNETSSNARLTAITNEISGIRFRYGDSNNVDTSRLFFYNMGFSVDDEVPNIIMTSNDTSLSFADSVNITGNFTDNRGLDFCQITTNQSNSTEFFNFTLSGLSDECSQNLTISASTNAIVNFSIIVNDSSNNINLVTQLITIGDETPPFIQNINISKTTLTTDETLNLSFRCEDTDATIGQSFLDTMNFSIQLDGGTTNLTRNINFLAEGESGTGIRLDTVDYIWNYTLFKTDETAQVGNWSVTAIACIDRAENYFVNDSVDLIFEMTEVPLPPPPSTGGGGGGGQPAPTIEYEERVEIVGQCNFNAVCEPDFGEDFINCPDDCEFATAGLNPLCIFRPVAGEQCIYRTGLFARLSIVLALISGLIIVSDTAQGIRIRRWFKTNLNLNLFRD